MDARQRRMLEGARNYAAADRSDPFAYSRAITHIRTGIADISQGGEDRFYSAEPFTEQRVLPDGTTYSATAYKNIRRP